MTKSSILLLAHWWRDLSVVKKLYAVVGVMALLIATELFTLLFAMNTLSSLRAFVMGEGLWTKAQKDALHSLYQYSIYGGEKYFTDFKNYLAIPDGDHQARLELSKQNPKYNIIFAGFEKGGNHPDDIDGMIRLLVRYHRVSYIGKAIEAWTEADIQLADLRSVAEALHTAVRKNGTKSTEVDALLKRIADINLQLSRLEGEFSSTLSAGSRWLERLLMWILALTVLTVESTGIFLTFKFSQTLSRSLNLLKDTAAAVGKGNFDLSVPVNSKDELGQLAQSLNQMIGALKGNVDLKRAKEEADVANATKSAFLANMSHEIRTPLGAILGFSELMAHPDLTVEERNSNIEVIRRNGNLLSKIINDILDLSKVEAGKLDIERVDVEFSEVISEVEALLSLAATNKGIQLVVRSEGVTPSHINTDPLRLRQILLNIVGNAIKFTQKGSVEIRVRLITAADQKMKLAFYVRDTGCGLTAEQAEKLFVPFTQADVSTTREFGGTGLGLVLSKKFANALGGDVVLESSVPNVGSTFVVTIDPGSVEKVLFENKSKPLPLAEMHLKNPRLDNVRVLVVDDSAENQLLITRFLRDTGAKVETANDGKEGLNKALDGKYDLIFMDLQMPTMDGYEATKALRERGFVAPIVALTAHAMKEDRDRSLENGFNDHITKPIGRKLLLETISFYTSPPPPA